MQWSQWFLQFVSVLQKAKDIILDAVDATSTAVGYVTKRHAVKMRMRVVQAGKRRET